MSFTHIPSNHLHRYRTLPQTPQVPVKPEIAEASEPRESFSTGHKILRTAAGISTSILGAPSTLIGPLVTAGGENSGECGGCGYGITRGLLAAGAVSATLLGMGAIPFPAVMLSMVGGVTAGIVGGFASSGKDTKLAQVSEAKARVSREGFETPALTAGRAVAEGYKVAVSHGFNTGAGFVDGFLDTSAN